LFSDWAGWLVVGAVAECERFVVVAAFVSVVLVKEQVDVLASAGSLFIPLGQRFALHTDGPWLASTALRVARSW